MGGLVVRCYLDCVLDPQASDLIIGKGPPLCTLVRREVWSPSNAVWWRTPNASWRGFASGGDIGCYVHWGAIFQWGNRFN